MDADELKNEVSNLEHDYAICSTRLNNCLQILGEAKRWIKGHAHIAGITANIKAEQILAEIERVEAQ